MLPLTLSQSFLQMHEIGNNCRKISKKKKKGEDIKVVYWNILHNLHLQNNSIKTAFYTTIEGLRGEYNEQWKTEEGLVKTCYFSSQITNLNCVSTAKCIKFVQVQNGTCSELRVQSSKL